MIKQYWLRRKDVRTKYEYYFMLDSSFAKMIDRVIFVEMKKMTQNMPKFYEIRFKNLKLIR